MDEENQTVPFGSIFSFYHPPSHRCKGRETARDVILRRGPSSTSLLLTPDGISSNRETLSQKGNRFYVKHNSSDSQRKAGLIILEGHRGRNRQAQDAGIPAIASILFEA